jgi:hypothetical protein
MFGLQSGTFRLQACVRVLPAGQALQSGSFLPVMSFMRIDAPAFDHLPAGQSVQSLRFLFIL